MIKTIEFISEHLPLIRADDIVRRFSSSIEIHDLGTFAAELQEFLHDSVEAVDLPPSLDVLSEATTEQALARKAAALHASTRWVPEKTDIQRGRAALLASFKQPHNLSLPAFAHLANKSRQQIYKDIDAHRLLALSVGPRGQKLPDWQLDPVKQQLTQSVLQKAAGIDHWTLYHALSEPLESLGGRAPVNAVTASTIDDMANVVCNILGIH
ncbi:MAG: integrase [Pseudomonadales bacterium]|jgi:hypothetical protein|nr:integrase [Pseudomonadales bacterium]